MILTAVLALSSCSSFLYYPTQDIYVRTEQMPRPPTQIDFRSSDGTKLIAWWFQSDKLKKPKALFVFFHGNGQNISAHFWGLYWSLNYGYDYFIFDYPGYGGSEGEPTPEKNIQAGLAAIEKARDLEPDTPIVIFGQSLGGAVALRTVAELNDRTNIKGVVVESTFDSYKSAARRVMGANWVTWILQPFAWLLVPDTHAPKGHLKELEPLPLLVIHGTKDEVIPFDLGERLFENLPEPKEFWSVENGHHIDTFTGPKRLQMQKKLNQYLVEKILKEPVRSF